MSRRRCTTAHVSGVKPKKLSRALMFALNCSRTSIDGFVSGNAVKKCSRVQPPPLVVDVRVGAGLEEDAQQLCVAAGAEQRPEADVFWVDAVMQCQPQRLGGFLRPLGIGDIDGGQGQLRVLAQDGRKGDDVHAVNWKRSAVRGNQVRHLAVACSMASSRATSAPSVWALGSAPCSSSICTISRSLCLAAATRGKVR